MGEQAVCFWLVLLGVGVISVSTSHHHHGQRNNINPTNDFDMIVFAQQWPETVCIQGNLTKHYACAIAKNVSTWTVHGLWPTMNGTLGPNYCNDSNRFQPGPVAPLVSELTEYWPNLHTDDTFYGFWTHEWDKHGTCAQSLPALQGEYNFFNMGLILNKKLNTLRMLSDQNYPPRIEGYDYPTMKKAFTDALGAEPTFGCFYQKKYGTQYLMQIDICLDKSFEVVDCKRSSGGCVDSKPLVYPPIKHPFSAHRSPVDGH